MPRAHPDADFGRPDQFVVGYGLDYAEVYRNLKDVCVLENGTS